MQEKAENFCPEPLAPEQLPSNEEKRMKHILTLVSKTKYLTHTKQHVKLQLCNEPRDMKLLRTDNFIVRVTDAWRSEALPC
jgi:hypothetical protein